MTLSGFRHDACAAVHPWLVVSPFFRSVDLRALGIVLCQPEVAFPQPLGDSEAAAVFRSVGETASPRHDAAAYRSLLEPIVDGLEHISS